jgi:phage repressor protein C with HTH and peptisase S24 domain
LADVNPVCTRELDYRNAGVHNLWMAEIRDYAKLVRDIRTKTGENQSQLADRLKVSQPSVSRWLAGNPPELHHAQLLDAEARRLRLVNSKSVGNVTSVQIVGYVGAGGTISFDDSQGPYGEADMPPKGGSPTLVAVIVKGDSMSGTLEDGWTVYYDNRRDPPDESLHSKLCIVGLRDGRTLIKKLYPGRKRAHYDLHSVNAPPLLDQLVDWAAKITWIAPK